MDPNSLFLIVIVIAMIAVMWWQSRSSKKRQNQQQEFRNSLKPGDPVATYSGLVGVIESVDLDIDQVVINSEGSLSRWRVQAITQAPVVPNYVTDEEYEQEQAANGQDDAQDDVDSRQDATSDSNADYVNPGEVVEVTEEDIRLEGDVEPDKAKDAR